MSDDPMLPTVEYEDINSGGGTLNKDLTTKTAHKSGTIFHPGDVLYGKLRPYLHNWLFPQFIGIAVGDFWVLCPREVDGSFLYRLTQSGHFDELASISAGSKMPRADWALISDSVFAIPPSCDEQRQIGTLFSRLDSLITLHQRESPAGAPRPQNVAARSILEGGVAPASDSIKKWCNGRIVHGEASK